MISLKNKFLFIHVPKTGGNSIQNILRGYSEDKIVVLAEHQDGVERFEVRNDIYNITKHSSLSHYKSVLDRKTYDTLFKFAVIRNPWDRTISHYFSPHRGIKEWNRSDFMSFINTVRPLQRYICLQSRFDKILKKLPISCIFGNHELDKDIDFLMRFEHIDDDFKLACEKLNIPYTPLPKRNVSNRKHYSAYYDEELIQVVQRRFNDEVLYGNYEFEKA